ncbi:nitroreductase family protein [Ileibacterium valens]|uniref:nitroreductase family protein n=1 Tax=Ileibacterium valens TaxID=1862668 RepID=UPI002572CB47|nr:nitroreductase family protein [Ileibacterium valens]
MNEENLSAYDLLLKRRSVRAYTDKPVSNKQIEKILTAASYAPSAKGRQPFAFLAVTNPKIIQTLSQLNADVMRKANPDYQGDPFYKAPCVFGVLVLKDLPTRELDGAAAIENMLLAACSLGLGSCWINRAREVFETREGKEILNQAGIDSEAYTGIGFVIAGEAANGVSYEAASRKSVIGVIQ